MTLTDPRKDGPEPTDQRITVLLVDDSVVIRSVLTRILKSFDDVRIVADAENGQLGVEAAQKHKPDIVIMDIEMPVMDGLTALPKVMEASPNSKIIMFSSLTSQGADVTMKALALGAVECIVKPNASEPVNEGSDFQRNLITIIRNLASKTTKAPHAASSPEAAVASESLTPITLLDNPTAYKGKPSIVMIGSSTGGPQALFEVIKNFENFDVPIVITQHMPAKFTAMLAQHIRQNTGLESHEGEDGMSLENGHVYVAPGGYHMHLVRNENRKTVIKLEDTPAINFCKPSVDPMFFSALEIYGQKALGVILTGMGSDGLDGAKLLVEKGGRLVAQDEATSVVWGMPGAVAKAGICSKVLPLQEIGPWIKKAVLG